MTYKELLFKMARRGMLSLSNDKDGRGLFWVSMNNMRVLEREFDWKDFEGEDPPRKEYYIDRQGRKQEKCEGLKFNQSPFRADQSKDE